MWMGEQLKLDVKEMRCEDIQLVLERSPVFGFCEHVNEISLSIIRGQFFDYLSENHFLKLGSVPWSQWFENCDVQIFF
jgi:hypothetical protein